MVEQVTTGGESPSQTPDEKFKKMMVIMMVTMAIVFIQMLRDRKWWLGVEAVIGVVGGVMIVFPQFILERWLGMKADTFHVYGTRLLGCFILGQAESLFMLENTSDKSVGVSLATSRILSRVVVAFTLLNAVYFEKVKSVYVTADMVFFPLMILYDILRMPKLSRDYGALTVGDPLSFHVTFDSFVTFVVAMLMFGFPDMFVFTILPEVTTKATHLLIVRLLGAYYLGSALLSLAALTFKRAEDMMNVLRIKLITMFAVEVAFLLTVFYHPDMMNRSHAVLVMGVSGLLAVNAYVGLGKPFLNNKSE